MSTAQATADLINLNVTDWRRTRTVHLEDVPRNATVGEVLGTAVRALQLPFKSAFRAAFGGRQLNRGATLEELGIGTADELELLPDVSAGGRA